MMLGMSKMIVDVATCVPFFARKLWPFADNPIVDCLACLAADGIVDCPYPDRSPGLGMLSALPQQGQSHDDWNQDCLQLRPAQCRLSADGFREQIVGGLTKCNPPANSLD
jgi:hypothetical protein